MTDRTKKTLLALVASVGVIGGAAWAYYTFTTVPPPDLTTAKGADVVAFLGSGRGFARLPVDDREEFLVRTHQRFSQRQDGADFTRALRRMSHRQQQVFFDASADVFRVRAVQHARAFNKLKSPREKVRFVDKAMRDFDTIRQPLRSGGSAMAGGPGVAPVRFGDVFKDVLPKGSDELMKVVIDRSTAKERSEIKPFVDAWAARYRELKKARHRRQI